MRMYKFPFRNLDLIADDLALKVALPVVLVLLFIVVVGLVVWHFKKNRKTRTSGKTVAMEMPEVAESGTANNIYDTVE